MRDSVTLVDDAHRAAMQNGSDMLRNAIIAARNGTHPGTSTRPMKLPPEGRERNPTSVYVSKANPNKREAILAMSKDGKKPGEIAKALHTSHQHVTAVLGAARKRKQSGLLAVIKERLWGNDS